MADELEEWANEGRELVDPGSPAVAEQMATIDAYTYAAGVFRDLAIGIIPLGRLWPARTTR